jgi:hypothetical protein
VAATENGLIFEMPRVTGTVGGEVRMKPMPADVREELREAAEMLFNVRGQWQLLPICDY